MQQKPLLGLARSKSWPSYLMQNALRLIQSILLGMGTGPCGATFFLGGAGTGRGSLLFENFSSGRVRHYERVGSGNLGSGPYLKHLVTFDFHSHSKKL